MAPAVEYFTLMFVMEMSDGRAGRTNLYPLSWAYASTDVVCTAAFAVVEYAP